jgi:uncharacterized membrane protein
LLPDGTSVGAEGTPEPAAAPAPAPAAPRGPRRRAKRPIVRWSAAAPATLAFALLASALGLAVAYLMKQPCTTNGWANFFQYRHLCYNDIQPLFYVRKVSQGVVPYKDVQVEYPVLIGSFMYVVGRLLAFLVSTGLVSNYSDPQYFNLTALLLAPCSVAVTVLLRPRVTRGRLLLWAIGTPTVLYSFLNWDLLAVIALVAGLVAVDRRRWGWAGIALGLGASAKLYPGFILPCAFLGAWSIKDFAGARRLVVGFLSAAIAANLPWMVAAFSGWMGIWKFQAGRYPDYGTMWYWVARMANSVHPAAFWNTNIGGWGSFIGDAGGLSFGVFSLLILWVGWRRRDESGEYPVTPTALAILCTFLVVSKVNSPQYALWILPLLVLVDIPWEVIVVYLVSDLALFTSGFYWFTELSNPGTPGWERIFEVSVFVRGAALAVTAILAATQGRRLLPAVPEPEPVGEVLEEVQVAPP